MAGENRADFVRAGERLMQLLGSTAGIGENHINALADEAFDNGVGALHFAANFSLGKRGRRGRGFHG